MSRLLFIGVDALDSVQFDRQMAQLPNLARLRSSGFYAQFPSVWPPDSETAWSSIYTGWNPARHGIFQFVDPLQKTSNFLMRERNNSVFRGATFWDHAGRAGRKVCVLFPHVGYPSWEVNGVMVSRASIGTEISVTPTHLLESYDFSGLNDVKGLAGRRRADFLAANRSLVERQLELSLQLMQDMSWDLFFCYWSALDLIQHQFWNYCDPSDPSFPGVTPFLQAIPDFYALHDFVVGRLIEAAPSDTNVIVMSDHGHGMRPPKIFNVNRVLKDNGLLFLRSAGRNPGAGLVKKAKNVATQMIGRYELGDLAAKVLKSVPWTKKVYVSAANLDLNKTIAYITDMSGIKAYTYGGIRIARKNLNGASYDRVREQIMALLLEVMDPDNPEQRVVRWIRPREELYAGPFIEDYPDLVFELQPIYGAGWDASGALFDVSHSHSLYPGSHIGENAVFLMNGPDTQRVHAAPRSMMDIAPTVLDLLGVPAPLNMDGSTILGT